MAFYLQVVTGGNTIHTINMEECPVPPSVDSAWCCGAGAVEKKGRGQMISVFEFPKTIVFFQLYLTYLQINVTIIGYCKLPIIVNRGVLFCKQLRYSSQQRCNSDISVMFQKV